MTFHPTLDRAAEAATQLDPGLAALVLGGSILAAVLFASWAVSNLFR